MSAVVMGSATAAGLLATEDAMLLFGCPTTNIPLLTFVVVVSECLDLVRRRVSTAVPDTIIGLHIDDAVASPVKCNNPLVRVLTLAQI